MRPTGPRTNVVLLAWQKYDQTQARPEGGVTRDMTVAQAIRVARSAESRDALELREAESVLRLEAEGAAMWRKQDLLTYAARCASELSVHVHARIGPAD